MPDLKRLVHTRYYRYDQVIKACKIVAEYIVKNKLVVYGGQAIDNALRIYGENIYEEYLIPDYDFYSPENIKHAYEIFKLLCDHYGQVGVMPAFHATTMKVRIFNDMVADSSYIKPLLYKLYKRSAINYKGMLSKHPFLQYADQCRAMSYPFENEGMEVILHRWVKDYSRMKLLYTKFPIGLNDNTETFLKKIKYPAANKILTQGFLGKMNTYKDDEIICGFDALAIYEREFSNLIGSVIDTDQLPEMPPDLGYTVSGDGSFTNKKCVLIEPGEYKTVKLPGHMIYEETADGNLPATHKTGYHYINEQKVVSIQFLIIYFYAKFLQNYKQDGVQDVGDDTIYLSAYLKMLRMVNLIFQLDYVDNFKIFYPSITVYGEEKLEPLQELFAKNQQLAREIKPPAFYYREDLDKDEVFKEIPENFQYDSEYFDL